MDCDFSIRVKREGFDSYQLFKEVERRNFSVFIVRNSLWDTGGTLFLTEEKKRLCEALEIPIGKCSLVSNLRLTPAFRLVNGGPNYRFLVGTTIENQWYIVEEPKRDTLVLFDNVKDSIARSNSPSEELFINGFR